MDAFAFEFMGLAMVALCLARACRSVGTPAAVTGA